MSHHLMPPIRPQERRAAHAALAKASAVPEPEPPQSLADKVKSCAGACCRACNPSDELAFKNATYSGDLTYATFNWTSGAFHRPAVHCTCCASQCGQLWWYVFFCRIVFMILIAVFGWLDLDRSGKVPNYPDAASVNPILRPNAAMGLLAFCYLFISCGMWFTRFCPHFQEDWDGSHALPPSLRFAWYCYDVALPGSVTGIVFHGVFHSNPFPPKSDAFALEEDAFKWAMGSYGVVVAAMIVDTLASQMILVPAHVYPVLLTWFVYAGLAFGMGYLPLERNGLGEFLAVTLGLIAFYGFFSQITYFRAAVSRTIGPLEMKARPFVRADGEKPENGNDDDDEMDGAIPLNPPNDEIMSRV